ncbi:MAG: FAD:protein FMN transferase [Phycisphaerales bacterium]
MGCRFELILDPADSPHDRFGVEAIADELVELIQDWHNRLSVFTPNSIVSRINSAQAGVPVRVDRDLFELLRLCDSLCAETEGAFNIAAGTLMHVHGFREQSDQQGQQPPIDLRRAFTLDAQSMTVTRNHPRVSLDFGAVAKGFVLDLLTHELREYGIQHAFIHGGSSSVLGFGNQDKAHPWRVHVSDTPDLQACLSSISLGISEHSGRVNAENRGHIMDPRTGEPADNQVERVVCTHPSAAIADAYSTALSVRPDLIDRLHEHGCSIAILTSSTDPEKACIRDRLGVFTNPISN